MSHPLVIALREKHPVTVRVEPVSPTQYVGKIYQLDMDGKPTFVLMTGETWDNPNTPLDIMTSMLTFTQTLVDMFPLQKGDVA